MSWVNVAIAAGSAVLNYYGSQQASDASSKANKKNSQLAQQQYNNSLAMYEPNRYLGYQAGADLANLYGWGTSGYTPLGALQYGTGGGSGNVTGSAGSEGGGVLNPNNVIGSNWGKIDPLGSALNTLTFGSGGLLGGGEKTRYGGTIDPTTGTVDVKGGHSYQDQALTHYLRTGEWTLTGKKSNELKKAIDELRSSGWTYDAATGAGSFPGQVAATPAASATSAGQPGNMDRFFTSPDYQFRRDEGQRDIGNSFAARGGAASGNALKALTEFNQNTAKGAYNDYVNNLFRAMGYGSQATSGTVDAGNTYANNQSQNNTQQGDIRASGIANAYGAGAGLLNSLGSIYGNYAGQQQQPSQYSQYGPYSSGYRMPNPSWTY